MILLTHPKHGVKHCYAESEALADIANGWVRADAAEATQAAPEATVTPEPIAPAQIHHAKRGRKPKGA